MVLAGLVGVPHSDKVADDGQAVDHWKHTADRVGLVADKLEKASIGWPLDYVGEED